MIKKNYFFMSFIVLIFISCNSIPKKAGVIDFSHESSININDFDEYYFTDNYIWPIIELKIGNETIRFLCDTCGSKSIIYKNGVKKIVSDFSTWEKNSILEYKEKCIEYNLLDSETNYFDVRNRYKKLAKTTCPGTILKIKCLINNIPIKDIDFCYTDVKENKFDGILAIDFFMEFENIIFDYKNRKLIFNAEEINNSSTPLIIDNLANSPNNSLLYTFISCKIGDNYYPSLLDTGGSCLILSKDYCDKVGKKDEIIEEITIADYILNKLNVRYYDDESIKLSSFQREVMKEYINLGYPVFENHVVQLDFQNMCVRFQ